MTLTPKTASTKRVPGRTGECTPGCGACCRYLELYIHPGYYQDEDTRKWVELHDIKLVWDEANFACKAYIKMPCSALTPDGMCGIMDTPERPELCGTWPTSRADLDKLADVLGEQPCTYGFDDDA